MGYPWSIISSIQRANVGSICLNFDSLPLCSEKVFLLLLHLTFNNSDNWFFHSRIDFLLAPKISSDWWKLFSSAYFTASILNSTEYFCFLVLYSIFVNPKSLNIIEYFVKFLKKTINSIHEYDSIQKVPNQFYSTLQYFNYSIFIIYSR